MPYGGVTGVASTDTLTVPNSSPAPGDSFVFTELTGGAGVTTGRQYFVLSPTGAAFQFAENLGGIAVDFTTNITAASIIYTPAEKRIWSPQYRDQFQTTIRVLAPPANNASPSSEINVPATLTRLESTFSTISSPVSSTNTAEPTYAELSDEVAHEPLRQTLLCVSHWRFTLVAGGFLYAVWQDGDIVSNNPPETDA